MNILDPFNLVEDDFISPMTKAVRKAQAEVKAKMKELGRELTKEEIETIVIKHTPIDKP